MNDLDYEKEISNLACQIIDGNIDMIVGCRNMTKLIYSMEDFDFELFSHFIYLESETQDIPKGDSVKLFSEEYISQAIDKENRYIKSSRDDIIGSCNKIIEIYHRTPKS